MENTDRVKANIRLLALIVSLPFWALLALQVHSVWLGDPYKFDITHVLILMAVYLSFRTVLLGKHPFGSFHDSKQ